MPGHDPQMLKGVLSCLLLELLHTHEDYGYALVLRLHDRGFTDLVEGTVYPALTRLEGQGLLGSRLVASTSGPARKYYSLTPAGSAELVRTRKAWESFAVSVSQVLSRKKTK